MQPILKMFDRRAFILAEDVAMKESLADPNRLLGRGRGMAEQLKKEEKVRFKVNKELSLFLSLTPPPPPPLSLFYRCDSW